MGHNGVKIGEVDTGASNGCTVTIMSDTGWAILHIPLGFYLFTKITGTFVLRGTGCNTAWTTWLTGLVTVGISIWAIISTIRIVRSASYTILLIIGGANVAFMVVSHTDIGL